jgi:hypothetical protein
MKEKPDVVQGTLALMVLKTLDVLGPQQLHAETRDWNRTAAIIPSSRASLM